MAEHYCGFEICTGEKRSLLLERQTQGHTDGLQLDEKRSAPPLSEIT
jgi:hypothetical protein